MCKQFIEWMQTKIMKYLYCQINIYKADTLFHVTGYQVGVSCHALPDHNALSDCSICGHYGSIYLVISLSQLKTLHMSSAFSKLSLARSVQLSWRCFLFNRHFLNKSSTLVNCVKCKSYSSQFVFCNQQDSMKCTYSPC